MPSETREPSGRSRSTATTCPSSSIRGVDSLLTCLFSLLSALSSHRRTPSLSRRTSRNTADRSSAAWAETSTVSSLSLLPPSAPQTCAHLAALSFLFRRLARVAWQLQQLPSVRVEPRPRQRRVEARVLQRQRRRTATVLGAPLPTGSGALFLARCRRRFSSFFIYLACSISLGPLLPFPPCFQIYSFSDLLLKDTTTPHTDSTLFPLSSLSDLLAPPTHSYPPHLVNDPGPATLRASTRPRSLTTSLCFPLYCTLLADTSIPSSPS